MLKAILLLISSIGIMLIGVKLLSEGLQKLLNDKIKRIVNMFAKNRFRTSLVGVFLTFAMQSSTASTIMCLGLASVGILSLFQGIAFIAGCNIGSSLTLFLLSFNDFSVKESFALFSFIGIVLTFFKNEKIKLFGKTLMGFGLIFAGLSFISININSLNAIFNIADLFVKINNPLSMFFLGVFVTILLQSSFGSIALLVSLIASGSLVNIANINSISFFVYGMNIGTTLTTLIVSLTSNADGKKLAIFHLLFNILGVIIFILLNLLGFTKLIELTDLNITFQIILIDIIFNTVTALLILIFLKNVYKILNKLVKQKMGKGEEIWNINSNTLQNPMLAIKKFNNQGLELTKRIINIYLKVEQNFYKANKTKKIYKEIDNLYLICEMINKNVYNVNNDLSLLEKENLIYIQFLTKTFKRILKILKKLLDINIVDGVRIELYQYQKEVVEKLAINQKLVLQIILEMIENFCLENKLYPYQEQIIKIFKLAAENSEIKKNQKLNYISNLSVRNNTEKKHYIYFNLINLLQDMTNYLSDISIELYEVVNNCFKNKGESYDKEFNTIKSK